MFEPNKYKNDFAREKYDRIGLMLPKGKGEEWKTEASARGFKSVNAFVQEAVNFYLQNCTDSTECAKTEK